MLIWHILSPVWAAMCGVPTKLSTVKSGFCAGVGSSSNTSVPAAAILPGPERIQNVGFVPDGSAGYVDQNRRGFHLTDEFGVDATAHARQHGAD